MIPLHEIVIKISNPSNNCYTAIVTEPNICHSTTTKLLGNRELLFLLVGVLFITAFISVSLHCFNCNSFIIHLTLFELFFFTFSHLFDCVIERLPKKEDERNFDIR